MTMPPVGSADMIALAQGERRAILAARSCRERAARSTNLVCYSGSVPPVWFLVVFTCHLWSGLQDSHLFLMGIVPLVIPCPLSSSYLCTSRLLAPPLPKTKVP